MVYIESLSYAVVFVMMTMITFMIKSNNVFVSAFFPVLNVLSDRMKTIAVCMVCGLLPVPGRIMVTSMCLDCTCKTNKTTGLLAYLTSHHYYMWSPLEKTIILPMAILGLTYTDMLIYMCIPLFVYICYTVYTISKHNVDPVDNIEKTNSFAWIDMVLLAGLLIITSMHKSITIYHIKTPSLLLCTAVFLCYMIMKYKPSISQMIQQVPFNSVGLITILLIVGTTIKQNIQNIEPYFSDIDIWVVCLISFGVSFMMGSSGKFAGLCVLTSTIYGSQWFVLFFMVDFVGYLLSPFHKCLPIAIANFKTPVKTMLQSLLPLGMMLLLYGVLSTLI